MVRVIDEGEGGEVHGRIVEGLMKRGRDRIGKFQESRGTGEEGDMRGIQKRRIEGQEMRGKGE